MGKEMWERMTGVHILRDATRRRTSPRRRTVTTSFYFGETTTTWTGSLYVKHEQLRALTCRRLRRRPSSDGCFLREEQTPMRCTSGSRSSEGTSVSWMPASADSSCERPSRRRNRSENGAKAPDFDQAFSSRHLSMDARGFGRWRLWSMVENISCASITYPFLCLLKPRLWIDTVRIVWWRGALTMLCISS